MEKSSTAETGAMSEQSSAPASLKNHDQDNNVATDEKETSNTASADIPVPPTAIAEETKPQAQPDEYVTGMSLWIIMTGLCLVFFLVLLDTSILATAIPRITNDFNSLKDVGWYGSAYQLSAAVLQPLAGKIYVNFKNKWTFITFFFIFELGSLLCGVANSSKMLIVGRAVAGMGTAGLQNGAFTIIAACVPLHKRPALMGICQGIAQLGVVFGPLIGGALTQYTTWRWCFYINLPVGGVVAVLLVFTRVPDQNVKDKPSVVVRQLHKKLDLVGFVLFAPAVIMLLLALQWGGNVYAWNSATIIGLFCGFGANILVWFAWDYYKGADAMIPVSIMKRPVVWSGCILTGILMGTMFCAAYYLPIYFQAVFGVTPTMSGVYMLPSIIPQIICAVATGRLIGLIGYPLPFALLTSVLASIGYGLACTFSPNTTTGEWIGYQILFGASRGFGFQMPLVSIQSTLTPIESTIGIALMMFTGMLCGAVFLSVASLIFTNSLRTLIPLDAPQVNAEAVIVAGATGFRSFLDPSQLGNVLVAYAKSIDRVFYMVAALSAASFFISFGLGWRDIRPKKKATESKA